MFHHHRQALSKGDGPAGRVWGVGQWEERNYCYCWSLICVFNNIERAMVNWLILGSVLWREPSRYSPWLWQLICIDARQIAVAAPTKLTCCNAGQWLRYSKRVSPIRGSNFAIYWLKNNVKFQNIGMNLRWNKFASFVAISAEFYEL